MDVRPLTAADEPALRAFLREDPWNRVYLLGILHWYGIAGPRARFTGAFANGRLAAVLAEGREVHCWYASPAAAEPAAAAALGPVLAASRVAVVLGPAPLVEALTGRLPDERRRRTASMVLAVSHEGMREGRPAHAVRRATPADLPALVDLYEGYEFDGYPTRRHVRRALEERLARSAIWVIELEGRLVAGRRVDAASPEVTLLGGLTVHPDYRGRQLGRDVRVASNADLTGRGVRHCILRHVGNPYLEHHEHREHAAWLAANLAVPPAPWEDLARRVRARLSREDRPCRRRTAEFLTRR